MKQPLSGIRVVDITSVLAGPYCTMLLGDLGAEVIKIEAPFGDMIRKSPPFVGEESAYYLYTNRNKRSMTLNLQDEKGRALLLELARGADVFVENFRPQTKFRLRIDYETLNKINPRLIYCSVSGFGQSGPWAERPGFDQIAQGMSGLMSITGSVESGPTRVGVAIGNSVASLFATYGILAALIERNHSGKGQYLETSLLEGLIAVLGFQAAKYFGTKKRPLPQGNDHASFAPYGTYKTKDGRINIAAATERMWESLCKALGLGELLNDPRFENMEKRVKNKDVLREILEAKLAGKTNHEWIEILNREGVACGPIYGIDEVFSDSHIIFREMLKQIAHPTCGTIELIGFPVKFGRTPCKIRHYPPRLGEHTNEILVEIGLSLKEIEELRSRGVI